jgi:hypothetical protein
MEYFNDLRFSERFYKTSELLQQTSHFLSAYKFIADVLHVVTSFDTMVVNQLLHLTSIIYIYIYRY